VRLAENHRGRARSGQTLYQQSTRVVLVWQRKHTICVCVPPSNATTTQAPRRATATEPSYSSSFDRRCGVRRRPVSCPTPNYDDGDDLATAVPPPSLQLVVYWCFSTVCPTHNPHKTLCLRSTAKLLKMLQKRTLNLLRDSQTRYKKCTPTN